MSTRSVRLAVTEKFQASNVDVDPGVYDGQVSDAPGTGDTAAGGLQYFMDVPHSILEVGMMMATVRTIEVTEQVESGLVVPKG